MSGSPTFASNALASHYEVLWDAVRAGSQFVALRPIERKLSDHIHCFVNIGV